MTRPHKLIHNLTVLALACALASTYQATGYGLQASYESPGVLALFTLMAEIADARP